MYHHQRVSTLSGFKMLICQLYNTWLCTVTDDSCQLQCRCRPYKMVISIDTNVTLMGHSGQKKNLNAPSIRLLQLPSWLCMCLWMGEGGQTCSHGGNSIVTRLVIKMLWITILITFAHSSVMVPEIWGHLSYDVPGMKSLRITVFIEHNPHR